jgi:hypothetical protein
MKYTKAQVEEQGRAWIAREVMRDSMTKNQWSAMKRRINRMGIKRTNFLVSSKGLTKEECRIKRNAIARDRYRQKKMQREKSASRSETNESQEKPS